MAESNLSRLEKAGLLNSKKLSATHKRRLKKLTSGEVSALIRIKEKLHFSGMMHSKRGQVHPDTFV